MDSAAGPSSLPEAAAPCARRAGSAFPEDTQSAQPGPASRLVQRAEPASMGAPDTAAAPPQASAAAGPQEARPASGQPAPPEAGTAAPWVRPGGTGPRKPILPQAGTAAPWARPGGTGTSAEGPGLLQAGTAAPTVAPLPPPLPRPGPHAQTLITDEQALQRCGSQSVLDGPLTIPCLPVGSVDPGEALPHPGQAQLCQHCLRDDSGPALRRTPVVAVKFAPGDGTVANT